MKRSALTIGAVTILAQGLGFSTEISSKVEGPPNCNGKCTGFNPDANNIVYVDENLNFADPKRYFIKGKCKCIVHLELESWKREMPPGIDDDPATPGDKNGLIEHDKDNHLVHSP
jgi:hypothetical protein